MKFTIRHDIDTDKIKDLLPTAYRGMISKIKSNTFGVTTLIVFPHDGKDVVKSNLVRRAIKKISSAHFDSLVVVGGCFTQEAIDILNEYKITVCSLSNFHWTDERYISIKTGTRKIKK